MINVKVFIIAAILGTARALAVPNYSTVNCSHTRLLDNTKRSSLSSEGIEVRDDPIAPNTGMCANHVMDNMLEDFTIVIGRPWDNAAGCNAVEETFNSKIPTISNWHCVDVGDGSGNTLLTFTTVRALENPGHADEALAIAYPDVKVWSNSCDDGSD